MSKDIEIITDQHFNGHDPETCVDYTCSNCWNVCLHRSFKYCPHCGIKLEWNIKMTDKEIYGFGNL